jgi:hypothetical protein
MDVGLASKKAVNQAVVFMWGSLVFSAMNNYTYWKDGHLQLTLENVLALGFMFATYALLTKKVEAGRNWARVTYMGLACISLPFGVAMVLQYSRDNFVIGFYSVLIYGLPIIASYMLFTNPGKLFFKRSHGTGDAENQLKKLHDLYQKGLITSEEFASKKSEILARL